MAKKNEDWTPSGKPGQDSGPSGAPIKWSTGTRVIPRSGNQPGQRDPSYQKGGAFDKPVKAKGQSVKRSEAPYAKEMDDAYLSNRLAFHQEKEREAIKAGKPYEGHSKVRALEAEWSERNSKKGIDMKKAFEAKEKSVASEKSSDKSISGKGSAGPDDYCRDEEGRFASC